MWKIDYEPSIFRGIFAVVSVIICSRYISFESFGNAVISVLFFLLIIPSLSVSIILDYGFNVVYIVSSYMISIFLLKKASRKEFDISRNLLDNKHAKALGFFIVLAILILLIKDIQSFNVLSLLSNVYDFRSENRSVGFFSYLLFWIPSILEFWILFLAFFKFKRVNYKFVVLGFLLAVFTFLVTGVKTQLFTPLLLSFLFILVKKTKYHFYNFCFLFPGMLLSAGYLVNNTLIIAVIDRIIYLPALLQLRYIDFFSRNELYLFKGSKISYLMPVTSSYNLPPGYIIDEAFGGNGMNGNTGSFGSIYGDVGVIGILFVLPFLILLLTILMNTFSGNRLFNSLLGAYYGYTLINAPLMDILLTHGVIIHLIILKYYNLKTEFYGIKQRFY